MRLVTRAFREFDPQWSYAPTSGEGAALFGGRFNRPGLAALYLSLDRETAHLEAQQGFADKDQPYTSVAYEIDCEDIVDLRTPEELTAWGVTQAILGGNWRDFRDKGAKVPTWDLADLMISRGMAGIVVPSFAPGARSDNANLVLWNWSESLPHLVKHIDQFDRLPKNRRSWLP